MTMNKSKLQIIRADRFAYKASKDGKCRVVEIVVKSKGRSAK